MRAFFFLFFQFNFLKLGGMRNERSDGGALIEECKDGTNECRNDNGRM